MSQQSLLGSQQGAHAGSRARVTSMGGLYDAATLHAPQMKLFAHMLYTLVRHTDRIGTYPTATNHWMAMGGTRRGNSPTVIGTDWWPNLARENAGLRWNFCVACPCCIVLAVHYGLA